MTRVIRAIGLVVLIARVSSGQSPRSWPAPDSVPPHDSFTVQSTALGEVRRINVYTPASYHASRVALPILYMPDGGLDEDFPHVVNTVDSLIVVGAIRPVIVVGIPNTQRRRDLTGPTRVASDSAIAPRVGGSEAFRHFLRDELIPEIDHRYRTTRERGIIGESLAGLFIVETFLRDHSLFTHYIALDPSVWWNAGAMIDSADKQIATFDATPRTLFIATSQEPSTATGSARLVDLLRAAATPGLSVTYVPRPDLTHANIFRAVKPAALVDAFHAAAASVVRPGIETFLADVPVSLRGKRVGLITNHTGIDRNRISDIDLIARSKDLRLVALLAPEHGIRGNVADGERIVDEVDQSTGVPIYSLYLAEDRGPTDAMLKNVDVLVYDLQEVGGRTWTYVSTMALAMQAAARKGIPFVVLDRPNPIGGEIVEGALLDSKFKSFVGMYPIPARHGMTVGELATMFNQKFEIGANLFVARVSGWRRSEWFDGTGLPWVNPSPNLRSLAAVSSYPGTVYFEGTTLTEGRGTDRPFEQIGAPWLDAPRVAALMNEKRLPGIRFDAITMSVAPTAAKHKGQTIPAIRFAITDRSAYRPVRTALILIDEIHRAHPREFGWTGTIDRLTGSDKVRHAVENGQLPALLEEWDREAAAFHESRKPFLLY